MKGAGIVVVSSGFGGLVVAFGSEKGQDYKTEGKRV